MKKELFVKLMREIEAQMKVFDKLSQYLNIDVMNDFGEAISNLIEVVVDECGFDHDDAEFSIEHYIYESAFGKTNTGVYDAITKEKLIDIKTPEDLWSYLNGDYREV